MKRMSNAMVSKWFGWESRSLKIDGAWTFVWVKRDTDGGWTVAWESIPCGERQVSIARLAEIATRCGETRSGVVERLIRDAELPRPRTAGATRT